MSNSILIHQPSIKIVFHTFFFSFPYSILGLLLAEVCCNIVKEEKSMKNKNIGILTMAKYTCGPWVALTSGIVYVFIHYSLLVAYIAEAGEILSSAVKLPQWTGRYFSNN